MLTVLLGFNLLYRGPCRIADTTDGTGWSLGTMKRGSIPAPSACKRRASCMRTRDWPSMLRRMANPTRSMRRGPRRNLFRRGRRGTPCLVTRLVTRLLPDRLEALFSPFSPFSPSSPFSPHYAWGPVRGPPRSARPTTESEHLAPSHSAHACRFLRSCGSRAACAAVHHQGRVVLPSASPSSGVSTSVSRRHQSSSSQSSFLGTLVAVRFPPCHRPSFGTRRGADQLRGVRLGGLH